ncbi:DUF4167 domain-containing protein [uncultured Sphingomonas sp.]|uniref:DUF4167 domain-containing protein n=1 Tax=uncultured Sphingomonas sp. TaxID=158754 RepID=UPI0035C95078
MINNRQNGRRRGRGGGGNGGGNGPRQGGQQGNGSRIDNRARGNASQLFEKYKNLAADTQRAGDRVNTEYYLQFADHYFRVLSEQRGRFDDQPQQRGARNDIDYDADEEFGDEGEPIRSGEQGDGTRADRDERPRESFRNGGDRSGGEPREVGDNRNGSDGRSDDRTAPDNRNARDNRNVGDSRNGEGRREWRDRNDRGGEQRPETIAGQHRAEPLPPRETLAQRAEEVLEADRPLDPPPARRTRRPRADEDAGEAPAAFEADRLPPALGVAANDAGPAEPKPRRRRPRAAEAPTAAE